MNLKKLELPGLELVDPNADYSGAQTIFIDFDGANDVSYDNEALNIHIDNIDIEDSGLTREEQFKIITELNNTFADTGVFFTITAPVNEKYSTVYVGGANSAFAEYGNFLGLAETIDAGNKIKNDEAFVFSDKINSTAAITETIAHETGHLLGFEHQDESSLNDYANSVYSDVTFTFSVNNGTSFDIDDEMIMPFNLNEAGSRGTYSQFAIKVVASNDQTYSGDDVTLFDFDEFDGTDPGNLQGIITISISQYDAESIKLDYDISDVTFNGVIPPPGYMPDYNIPSRIVTYSDLNSLSDSFCLISYVDSEDDIDEEPDSARINNKYTYSTPLSFQFNTSGDDVVLSDLSVIVDGTVANFNWGDYSGSGFMNKYILYVSDSPDFSGPEHQEESMASEYSLILEPGTWYWAVNCYVDGALGEWSYGSTFVVDEDHSVENDFMGSLLFNSPRNGTIEENQTDIFTFQLDSDMSYITIQTDVVTNGNLLDTVLEVYNGDQLIASDDDSGRGYYSRIQLTSLEAGEYTIKVIGSGAYLTGDYQLQATYDVSSPSQPAGLCSSVEQRKISFDWGDSQDESGIANYSIEVGIDDQFSQSSLFTAEDSTFDLVANHNGTYYWRVSATDVAGNTPSAWSATQSFTVEASDYHPENLTSQVSSGNVKLNWTLDFSGYDKFLVAVASNNKFENATLYESSTNEIELNIEQTGMYYWQVMALQTDGSPLGTWSWESQFLANDIYGTTDVAVVSINGKIDEILQRKDGIYRAKELHDSGLEEVSEITVDFVKKGLFDAAVVEVFENLDDIRDFGMTLMPDIDIELIAPDGTVYDHNAMATDSRFIVNETADSETISISNLDFEDWSVNLVGSNLDGEYEYNLKVSTAPADINTDNTVVFSEDFNDGDFTENPSAIVTNDEDIAQVPGIIEVDNNELHIKRENTSQNGGTCGIIYNTGITVTDSTTLEFDVNVVYASLVTTSGELPAQVSIRYTTPTEENKYLTFKYSYYGAQDSSSVNGNSYGFTINQNEWLRDETFILSEYIEVGATINEIFVYGEGHDYESRFDNILIYNQDSSAVLPGIPSNLSRDITDDSVMLDWSDSSGTTKYNIQVDDNNDFSSPEFSGGWPAESEITVSDLADGTYYWRVQGCAPSGYGEWAYGEAFVIDTFAAAPDGLDYDINGSTVTLTWDAVSDLSGILRYEYYLDDNADFSSPIAQSGTDTASFNVSDLAAGTYYWKVCSRDNAGNYSDWSSIQSFEVQESSNDMSPPTTPGGLSSEFDSDRNVIFSWTASNDDVAVDYYIVELSDSSGNIIADSWETETTSLLRYPPKPGEFTWRVRAVDTSGNKSSWSVVNSFYVTPEDQAGNSFALATVYNLSGEGVEEFVGFGDAYDYYTFDVANAGMFDFTLTGDDKNAKITVYAYDETKDKYKKLKNTSLKNGAAAIDDLLLDVGTYYVEIVSADKGKGKKNTDYTLNIVTDYFPEATDDNSFELATAYDLDGAGADGFVGFGDAYDYYTFDVANAGMFDFTLTGDDKNAKITVYAYDETKDKYKKLKNTSLKNGAAAIDDLLLDVGTYYVEIVSADKGKGKKNTDYTLNIVTDYFPEATDDNSFELATAYDLDGAGADGFVGFGDAQDVYTFTLNNAGTFDFSLTGLDAKTKIALYYEYESKGVTKYKKVKSVNSKYDKMKEKSSAWLNDILLDTDTYYIEIVSGDNGKGKQNTDYNLNVHENYFPEATNDNSFELAAAYDLNGAGAAGFVGFGDAYDYYTFDVANAGMFDFSLLGDDKNAKLTVYAYDETKDKYKKLKNKSLKNGVAAIDDLLLDVGTYYIEIVSSDKGKGKKNTDYTLNIVTDYFPEASTDEFDFKTGTGNPEFLELSTGGNASDSGWVGFGDALDVYYFQTESNGYYDIGLDGLESKVNMSVWYYNEAKDRYYKLKSVSGSEKTGTTAINDLLLKGGMNYYVAIESGDKGKGKYNSDYDLWIDGTYIDNGGDYAYAPVDLGSFGEFAGSKRESLVGGEWIGGVDNTDYYKFEIADYYYYGGRYYNFDGLSWIKFEFELDSDAEVEFSFMDEYGNLIDTVEVSNISDSKADGIMQLEDLSPGEYYIKVTGNSTGTDYSIYGFGDAYEDSLPPWPSASVPVEYYLQDIFGSKYNIVMGDSGNNGLRGTAGQYDLYYHKAGDGVDWVYDETDDGISLNYYKDILVLDNVRSWDQVIIDKKPSFPEKYSISFTTADSEVKLYGDEHTYLKLALYNSDTGEYSSAVNAFQLYNRNHELEENGGAVLVSSLL